MITQETISAAARLAIAIAGCIKDLGSVPAGHLYAQVMHKIDLDTFNACVATLVKTGLVRREPSHLLVWTGPVK